VSSIETPGWRVSPRRDSRQCDGVGVPDCRSFGVDSREPPVEDVERVTEDELLLFYPFERVRDGPVGFLDQIDEGRIRLVGRAEAASRDRGGDTDSRGRTS